MPHGAERDVEERRSGPEDTVAVEVSKENVDKNTTPGTTTLLFRSKKERLQKITTYLHTFDFDGHCETIFKCHISRLPLYFSPSLDIKMTETVIYATRAKSTYSFFSQREVYTRERSDM
jgi:hypothetical protein